jgi:hypothetical protein
MPFVTLTADFDITKMRRQRGCVLQRVPIHQAESLMPQINLYLAELLPKVREAMSTRGTAVKIWHHYGLRITEGGLLQVVKGGFEELGKMTLSERNQEVFFSKLLTNPRYEKQGIGTLVVTLGILYGMERNATSLRLGETDTNAQKGGHFWTVLGLSEAYATVHETLRKLLQEQRRLANKLGVTIDPNAILVAATPTAIAIMPTRRGSFSK